jgi:hypothetical protein
MPDYEVTIRYDADGTQTSRGAAEGVYLHLLTEMLNTALTMEVKDKKTGKVETINLEADLENDQSLLRFMALMQLAFKFMTQEQMAELEDWEIKNIDGHSIGTSDWPGWEPIIGKRPRRFRTSDVV